MRKHIPRDNQMPPRELLLEAIDYNPKTGDAVWKTRPVRHFCSQKKCDHWNRTWAGKPIGCRAYLPNGRKQYIQFSFTTQQDGRRFLCLHYVILAMEGIEVPSTMRVDHKDGDNWNNRRLNLRVGTPLQNTVNSTVHKDRIVSLPKNVFTRKNRPGFYARITAKGKRIGLGCHATPELAAVAVARADIYYNGEFAGSVR